MCFRQNDYRGCIASPPCFDDLNAFCPFTIAPIIAQKFFLFGIFAWGIDNKGFLIVR